MIHFGLFHVPHFEALGEERGLTWPLSTLSVSLPSAFLWQRSFDMYLNSRRKALGEDSSLRGTSLCRFCRVLYTTKSSSNVFSRLPCIFWYMVKMLFSVVISYVAPAYRMHFGRKTYLQIHRRSQQFVMRHHTVNQERIGMRGWPFHSRSSSSVYNAYVLCVADVRCFHLHLHVHRNGHMRGSCKYYSV
jgi:hypothetical protein